MFNPKFLLIFFFFSEISKNEDTLKEYMLYKQFLDSLTPQVLPPLKLRFSFCYSAMILIILCSVPTNRNGKMKKEKLKKRKR